MHLVVDISSHGYGHLAQTAPVLNRLAALLPELDITVRSALPARLLELRLRCRFDLQPRALDFGMLMLDATRVDLAATRAAYRSLHADWEERVALEARAVEVLRADLLLANVPYLSLAAAAAAGVPSLAMCSLNWLDLYRELCAAGDGADVRIVGHMEAAYASARAFLRLEPAMPMPTLGNVVGIGPVAAPGRQRREEIVRHLGIAADRPLVLLSMGGIPYALRTQDWPDASDLFFLVPGPVAGRRTDMAALESAGLPFPDLLASVDAVLTKPGYGSFVEAACSGLAVAYLRRARWPEQDALLSWLHAHVRCLEVAQDALQRGDFFASLGDCIAAQAPPPVVPSGVEEAAQFIGAVLCERPVPLKPQA